MEWLSYGGFSPAIDIEVYRECLMETFFRIYTSLYAMCKLFLFFVEILEISILFSEKLWCKRSWCRPPSSGKEKTRGHSPSGLHR